MCIRHVSTSTAAEHNAGGNKSGVDGGGAKSKVNFLLGVIKNSLRAATAAN